MNVTRVLVLLRNIAVALILIAIAIAIGGWLLFQATINWVPQLAHSFTSGKIGAVVTFCGYFAIFFIMGLVFATYVHAAIEMVQQHRLRRADEKKFSQKFLKELDKNMK